MSNGVSRTAVSKDPQELEHGPWILRDQVHGRGDSPGHSRTVCDEENPVAFFEQRHAPYAGELSHGQKLVHADSSPW